MKKLDKIVGFSGYAITKDGRVYSYKRHRFIKPIHDKHGYLDIWLWNNNKSIHKQVHRLIGSCYIPNPNKLDQINHVNGIKDDNRIENLEWCTPLQNTTHAWRTGLCESTRQRRCSLSNNQVLLIRKLYTNGENIYRISNKININYTTVKNCATLVTYKDIR